MSGVAFNLKNFAGEIIRGYFADLSILLLCKIIASPVFRKTFRKLITGSIGGTFSGFARLSPSCHARILKRDISTKMSLPRRSQDTPSLQKKRETLLWIKETLLVTFADHILTLSGTSYILALK